MLLLQQVTSEGDCLNNNTLLKNEQQLLNYYSIEDGSLCYVDVLDAGSHAYDAWLSNWDYTGAETRYFKVSRVHVDLTGE